MKKLIVAVCTVLVLLTCSGCAQSNNIKVEDLNSYWGMTAEQVEKGFSLDLPEEIVSNDSDKAGAFEVYYVCDDLQIEGVAVNMTLYFNGYCNSEPLLHQIKLIFPQAGDSEEINAALQNLPDYIELEGNTGFYGKNAVSSSDLDWLNKYSSIRAAESGFITEQGRFDPASGEFSGSGTYIGSEYPLVTLQYQSEAGVIQLTNAIDAMLNQKEAVEEYLKPW